MAAGQKTQIKESFRLQIMTAEHLPLCFAADRKKKADLIAIRCRECDDVREPGNSDRKEEKGDA